jgi:putative aldouronate transport system permease protein
MRVLKRKFTKYYSLHLMILPAFVLVLIYSYGPMLGIIMAFQDYIPAKGFFQSEWVGLDNFDYMFKLPDTGRVIYNTLFIATLKIIGGLIAPIVVALLLNEVRKAAFKRSVQTLIYLPHFLSWIILGGILIDILSPSSGIVNKIIVWLGGEPIYFLGNPTWFPYVLVLSDIWKEFGFGTIIYLAALTGINPALYEAAVVDGAGRWKQTLNITLPGIMPVVVLLATLSLGNVVNAGFDQVFNLYSPQVYSSGDIIDTLVYRIGMQQAQYSIATAIGVAKSLVACILISLSYFLAYRFANYRIF